MIRPSVQERLAERERRREERNAEIAAKQEERRAKQQAKQKARQPESELPCDFRGETIGRLVCNCRNKPDVYECAAWSIGKCILKPTTTTMDGPIRYPDGTNDPTRYIAASDELPYDEKPLAGIPRLPACSLCPKRKTADPAPVVPVDPFPKALAETLETRQRICAACCNRESCTLIPHPNLLEFALMRCPAGFWQAARSQPETPSAETAHNETAALTLETSSWQMPDARGNSGPTVSPRIEQAEPGNG